MTLTLCPPLSKDGFLVAFCSHPQNLELSHESSRIPSYLGLFAPSLCLRNHRLSVFGPYPSKTTALSRLIIFWGVAQASRLPRGVFGLVGMAETDSRQRVLRGQQASGPLLLASMAHGRLVGATTALRMVGFTSADEGPASPLPLKNWSVSAPLWCSPDPFSGRLQSQVPPGSGLAWPCECVFAIKNWPFELYP